MKKKETIVNEEQYRIDLRNYFNNLLNGRLLSFDLEKLKEDDFLDAIRDYDSSEMIINNNFCTWVTIGNIESREHKGKTYKIIQFTTEDDVIFEINFSQFEYPMNPKNKNDYLFPIFNATNAIFVCSIDGHRITPELFFEKHKGEKLLFLYCFPAITAFNTEKTCYLFAQQKISPSQIKKYIQYGQHHTIKEVLETPTLNIPGTTVKIEFLNVPNIPPMYFPNLRNAITDEFAISLFEEEFREKFESIYTILIRI